MGCCCSCLNSCCCTEAGLRCHSVVTLCGAFFFLLMFALFDRQEAFFEFEMEDPEGIKWACLFSALLWILLFVIVMYKLLDVNQNQNRGALKNKISIADVKSMRNSQQFVEQRGQEQSLLRQKKG